MAAHLTKGIDTIQSKNPYTGWIISGDFNSLPDRLICTITPLKQVVKVPTRWASTIDKIFTNMGKYYTQPTTLPPIGKSDQHPVEYSPNPEHKQNKGKSLWKSVRRFGTNGKHSSQNHSKPQTGQVYIE